MLGFIILTHEHASIIDVRTEISPIN